MIWGRRQTAHAAAPVIVARAKRNRPLEPRRTTHRQGFRALPPQKPRGSVFVRTVH